MPEFIILTLIVFYLGMGIMYAMHRYEHNNDELYLMNILFWPFYMIIDIHDDKGDKLK